MLSSAVTVGWGREGAMAIDVGRCFRSMAGSREGFCSVGRGEREDGVRSRCLTKTFF